jgi:hypothetical protein
MLILTMQLLISGADPDLRHYLIARAVYQRERQVIGSEKDSIYSEKESIPKVRLSPEDMMQFRRRLGQLGRRLNRAESLADLRVFANMVRSFSKKSRKE